jgi:divalent metal cation (Fe/Co/Zn/Cd) transporter
MATERADGLQTGVRLEVLTVVWMVIEATVSIGAGIVAGSLLLIAFGLDSVIELVSGSALLWRLSLEARGGQKEHAERVEHTALWVVAVTLGLLCVYVAASSVLGLATQAEPETSPVGIAVSLAAVLMMPYLAWRKRTVARQLGSEALEGDAAESITCAYMAGTVLVGLVLNALLGWWWAEYAAALVFLAWLGRETREAFQEARGG